MADNQKEFDEQLRQAQLRRLELENRKLERDIQTDELAEQNLKSLAKRNGQTLEANNQAGERKIANCNHKKGGKGLEGFRGHGDGKVGGYSVIMHMYPNGDVAVICTRCPKIWLPPIVPKRDDFDDQKEFAVAVKKYEKDRAEYNWALALPTDNEMSTSGLFRGGTFESDCREALHAGAAHPQDV